MALLGVISKIFFYLNHCRRSPISIAAAVIYIITQLSEEKKPLRGLCSTSLAQRCFRFLDKLEAHNLLAEGAVPAPKQDRALSLINRAENNFFAK